MWEKSSIDGVKDTLERIKQRRKLDRVLNADRDAAEIVACVQKLQRSVDRFLVGDPDITSCLHDLRVLVTGRNYGEDRDRIGGTSEHMTSLLCLLNVYAGYADGNARTARRTLSWQLVRPFTLKEKQRARL